MDNKDVQDWIWGHITPRNLIEAWEPPASVDALVDAPRLPLMAVVPLLAFGKYIRSSQGKAAAHEPPKRAPLHTVALALARSRAAAIVRRFKGLHPAVQGISIGAFAVAIVGAVQFLSRPAPPDTRSVPPQSVNSSRPACDLLTMQAAMMARAGGLCPERKVFDQAADAWSDAAFQVCLKEDNKVRDYAALRGQRWVDLMVGADGIDGACAVLRRRAEEILR